MAIVEFAPLQIPLKRRIQTTVVVLYYYSFYFGALLCSLVVFGLFFTSYYPLALLYVGWAYLYDGKRPSRGGRRSNWVRNLKVWHHFKDYFPIELIKTAELDPQKNYIFGYHPHGILCAGAFSCFGTNATGFEQKFPGITPHLLPLMALFKPPLFRDYIMMSGMCDASKESCEYILSKKGPGNSICLVVGGAVEALDAHPGKFSLVLKKRKGFVKVALSTGASLVPVFSFGENDLFCQVNNPKGSLLRDIQSRIQSAIAFAPPLFYGRGIFQYSFGLLPHRRPVNVVVGSPINVPLESEPTQAQIDILHERYVDGLENLFEEHKSKYGIAADVHLDIS